jgi:hypothetical protein
MFEYYETMVVVVISRSTSSVVVLFADYASHHIAPSLAHYTIAARVQ